MKIVNLSNKRITKLIKNEHKFRKSVFGIIKDMVDETDIDFNSIELKELYSHVDIIIKKIFDDKLAKLEEKLKCLGKV